MFKLNLRHKIAAAVVGAIAVAAMVSPVTVLAVPPSTDGTFNANSVLRIDGSTTVYPILKALLGTQGDGGVSTASYGSHSNVQVEVWQGGSGVGKNDCRDYINDLGAASSSIGSSYSTLTEYKIARDGVCVIINKNGLDAITNITTYQISQIMTGSITNWSQLGGPNQSIKLEGRQIGSGTRDTILKFCAPSSLADQTDANGNVTAHFDTAYDAAGATRYAESSQLEDAVNSTQWSFGYVGVGYALNPGANVKVVNVNGIYPSPQNVTNGRFPISRFLYLDQVTSLDSQQTGYATVNANRQNAADFITYIRTRAAQNTIVSEKFVRLNPLQDVNGDGSIDTGDVFAVGTKWNQTVDPNDATNGKYDVNGDGSVNTGDVVSIGTYWNLVVASSY